MTTHLQVGEVFNDFALPNHQGELMQLSEFTQPNLLDRKLGFLDGYPLIVVFYRGFFCPRDRQQFSQLVQLQPELAVNYCQLVTISTDPPLVQAAFRAGLGAQWTFLADEKRELINQINILDVTEGEYADRAQPYTFVLRPNLTVHKIYNGWFFVGRPTLEELRIDLRTIMQTNSNYSYEDYNTPEVKQIRIPQQEWANGTPLLGANGLPVRRGIVRSFDFKTGNGVIAPLDTEEDIFFNFTAIPGEGYRTVNPGTKVEFEVVTGKFSLSARNVQIQN
ncbi:redoxin domain-containing protein [Chlorogloea sp. CCALA 695]|uniref:redoxin domain-containing protein n=1 Tax=Chlorogloea sp. CCALA 695 TaxID=2107693 RepID=UPI000D049AD0|nr:redoxin domain-containing protein [Chlorogloea sp. CCALA 695]PSB28797.1 cold-shock protein [Chlorogloea sp. CCALA 695]